MPSPPPEGLDVRLSDAEAQRLMQGGRVTALDRARRRPARSSRDRRHNLPTVRTRLIGRDEDVVAVRQAVLDGDGRLVTLTGTGGCGKTRLALQVALGLVEVFPHGVWWVELAPLADPALVPQAVATALGVRERPGRSLLETLRTFVAQRHLLVILDNCEHVIAACADLAETLLAASASLRLLTTSRESLRIAGEVTWRVPPLATPDWRAGAGPEGLAQYAAVRLFVERAQAIQSDFALTSDNARAVAAMSARLEGLPLAIELAVSWVRALGTEQLCQRLDATFRSRLGSTRTASRRQQTVWATLDWSSALLTEAERAVLRRLSVFAGGWRLEAAEAVCSGGIVERADVLGHLRRLVDTSWVEVQELAGDARYRLLEPIRVYAADQLAAAQEVAATRRAHATALLDFAERHSTPPFVVGGAYRSTTARRHEQLEWEHDNVRAALRWAEESGSIDLGVRLCAAIGELWLARGYWSEGRRWLATFLDMPGSEADPAALAKALRDAGTLAWDQGDLVSAWSLLTRAVAVYRTLPNAEDKVAGALDRLGLIPWSRGQFAEAHALFQEALALARRFGPPWVEMQALFHLGLVAYGALDWPTAQQWYTRSLELAEAAGETVGIARALRGLAQVAHQRREYARARSLYERVLAQPGEVGDPYVKHLALIGLGQVLLDTGELVRARAVLEEARAVVEELGDCHGLALWLEAVAGLAALTNQSDRAWRLVGAAGALRALAQVPLPAADSAQLARRLEPARRALDEPAMRALHAAGGAMSVEDAVALARDLDVPRGQRGRLPGDAPAREQPTSGLTPRQTEILRLVAEGKTDRQIALQLVLSEKTVGRHLENIYSRLGVSSRAAATAVAIRQGLS